MRDTEAAREATGVAATSGAATRRWRLALGIVLALYLVLAVGYSLATPAGEGPDEPGHIAYVQFLLSQHRLPRHGEVSAVLEQQVKHPPLYYALGALATAWANYEDLLFIPNPQFSANLEHMPVAAAHRHTEAEQWPYAPEFLAVRGLRLVSVLLGLVLVWATWALGRTVMRGQPELALAAAAIVAFLPQLLFMQGVANNDALAVPLAALVLLLAARVALGSTGRRDLLLLGSVLGLALLTKLTTLALVGIAALALMVAARRVRSWRLLARGALWVGGPLAVLSGWWFARNLALSGDLLGWGRFEQAAEMSLRRTPLLADLPQYFLIQRTSFLGRFGWMSVPLPGPAYGVFAVAVGVAITGLVLLVVWRRRRPDAAANPLSAPDARWGVALLVATVVLVYLSVFRLAFTFDLVVAQGRYLFTALPAVAVLAALGLLGWWPARWRVWGSVGLAAILCAFAFYALVTVLRPAFALPPPVSPAILATLRQRDGVVFGGEVELVGDVLVRRRYRPGQVVAVPLVWDVLRKSGAGYKLFGQVVDAEGRLVGQVEGIPLDGRYPASSWLVGRPFSDTLRIPIAPDAAPGQAHVLVGWYLDGHPDQRLPVRSEGRVAAVGTTAPAGAIGRDDAYHIPIVVEGQQRVIVPAAATSRADTWPVPGAGGAPPAGRLPAAGRLQLVAFATAHAPDRTLLLDLYWRSDVALLDDYTIFVHLAQTGEAPAVTADGPPAAGHYPPPLWLPGETVLDAHRLSLTDVSPGTYQLSIGLYNGRTGRRRPALDASSEPWAEGEVVLGEVVVGEGGAWVVR